MITPCVFFDEPATFYCLDCSQLLCQIHQCSHIREEIEADPFDYLISSISHNNSKSYSSVEFKIPALGVKTLEKIYKLGLCAHKKPVKCMIESAKGKFLITSSEDATIKIWDPISGSLNFTIFSNNSIATHLIMTKDSQLLIAGMSTGKINCFDFHRKSLEFELNGSKGPITSIILTSDEKLLISSSEDRKILIWSLDNKCIESVLEKHRASVLCLALTKDDSVLASGALDGTVILWSLSSRRVGKEFIKLNRKISFISFCMDDLYIALPSLDRCICIYSIEHKTLKLPTSTDGNGLDSINSLQCADQFLLETHDSKIRLWDYQDNQLSYAIPQDKQLNFSVISYNQMSIFMYLEGCSVYRYDVHSDACSKILQKHGNQIDKVYVMNDFTLAVTVCNKDRIMIWDLKDVGWKSSIDLDYGVLDCMAVAKNIAFILFVCSSPYVFKVYDIEKNKVIRRFSCGENKTLNIAICKGSQLVVAAGEDYTYRILRIQLIFAE